MARRMPYHKPLRDLQETPRKRLPVDLEIQIMREIDAEVRPGRDAVESVFEFDFVHVDGDVRGAEVLQSAGVVEVQVAHDHGFDVGDGVARAGDGGGEFLLRRVVDAREDVVEGRVPDGGVVVAAAGFEEDEAGDGVRDQDGDHG